MPILIVEYLLSKCGFFRRRYQPRRFISIPWNTIYFSYDALLIPVKLFTVIWWIRWMIASSFGNSRSKQFRGFPDCKIRRSALFINNCNTNYTTNFCDTGNYPIRLMHGCRNICPKAIGYFFILFVWIYAYTKMPEII